MTRPHDSSASSTFASHRPSVAWLLGAHGLPTALSADVPALVWETGSRTYGELRERSLSLARSFLERGLAPGDTVACHLLNRGETFEVYFACAFAGLTMVPVSFRLSVEELTGVLADSRARLVLTEVELAETAASAVRALRESPSTVTLGARDGGPEYEEMARGPSLLGPFNRHDPHLVLFSSGTTGKPKGVMMGHEGILRYAMIQVLSYPGYRAGMRLLNVPAMFNTGGINEICIPTFMVGGTVYILPSKDWSAGRMIDLIERWEITHAVFFPTMFTAMFEADDLKRRPMPSLEVVIAGGELCPPAQMAEFRRRWPHVDLVEAYGQTEAGLITLIRKEEAEQRPGSVGRAVPLVAVKIGDADANPGPPGEVGEIWVASDAVVMGYHNAPELDEQSYRDGWFKTGDLGRVDDEGYLYLAGRSKAVIISKGQNVYPAEIEAVLTAHPAVRDAAVVGVPDPEYGEAVCAVVVVHPGHEMSDVEVVDWVTAHIASYKKPRHVFFRDRLPVSASNKVMRVQLAEELTALLEAR